MCSSKGSDRLYVALGRTLDGHEHEDRVRLRRGGCYGLCDLSPNVVVRRYDHDDLRPDPEDDLLSLSEEDHETAYCIVNLDEIDGILAAHLEDDGPYPAALRDAREAQHPPQNEVEARLRHLRQRRRARSKAEKADA